MPNLSVVGCNGRGNIRLGQEDVPDPDCVLGFRGESLDAHLQRRIDEADHVKKPGVVHLEQS